MSTPTPTPSGNRTQTQEKPIRVSDNPLDFRQFYFNYAKYHYNPTYLPFPLNCTETNLYI